jgi:hypothetical protein
MLEVQKYLRSGKTLDHLKSELGIFSHKKDDLVVLNYHQIDSPKTHPIVMECRSLILETTFWDVVSMAFRRFFNYGEAPEHTENLCWRNAYANEKVDGSLIQVFFYNDVWCMATRGTINGTGNVGFYNLTFRQLFDRVVSQYPKFYRGLNPNISYTFEIVSLENRIVTLYEDDALYLIAARNKMESWRELSNDEILYESVRLGIPMPARYCVSSDSDVRKLIQEYDAQDEGFVVCDYSFIPDVFPGSFSRIKMKNPAYLAMAKAKDQCRSFSAMLELIVRGKDLEFVTMFPEYNKFIVPLRQNFYSYLENVDKDINSVRDLLGKERTKENRKEYAILATKMTNPNFMFEVYNGKANNAHDCIVSLKKMCDDKRQNLGKKVAELLNVKDEERSEDA